MIARLCALVLAAQLPTFSSRLDVVRVDVLVTVNRQPVRGLTAPEFEVFDNGVAQRIDLVSSENVPLSIVLAADVSASVAGERLDHLRDASRAVLGTLKRDDRAALVTFSEAVSQDARLTANIGDLQAALDIIDPSGDTALIDGVYAGITVAEASAGRSLLIVFSDGSDTASWLTAPAVVDAGRRSDVVVYAVSAGARNPDFLRDVTTATGGRLYETESTKNLRAIFLSALAEFRDRYLVSYTPQGVTKGGWHKLEVRVKGRRAIVKARPGYLGGS